MWCLSRSSLQKTVLQCANGRDCQLQQRRTLNVQPVLRLGVSCDHACHYHTSLQQPYPRNVCKDFWSTDADEEGRGSQKGLLKVNIIHRGARAAGAACVGMCPHMLPGALHCVRGGLLVPRPPDLCCDCCGKAWSLTGLGRHDLRHAVGLHKNSPCNACCTFSSHPTAALLPSRGPRRILAASLKTVSSPHKAQPDVLCRHTMSENRYGRSSPSAMLWMCLNTSQISVANDSHV